MQRRMAAIVAIMTVCAIGVAGCKKKEEEKTEGSAGTVTTSTATPAPAAPAPGTPGTPAPSSTGLTGDALYKQYCAACHPNGGNTIKPDKPLNAKSLAEHNIKSAEDIVKVMRNPGPGMNKFDEATISDDDAKKIGEYILATFK